MGFTFNVDMPKRSANGLGNVALCVELAHQEHLLGASPSQVKVFMRVRKLMIDGSPVRGQQQCVGANRDRLFVHDRWLRQDYGAPPHH
jgi:hypothetical protein